MSIHGDMIMLFWRIMTLFLHSCITKYYILKDNFKVKIKIGNMKNCSILTKTLVSRDYSACTRLHVGW